MMTTTEITRLLREMRLGAAVQLLKLGAGGMDAAVIKAMIIEYNAQATRMQESGETGEAKRLARREAALNGLLLHGPDPSRLVAETELPEGYSGKVLMMRLAGGGFEDAVILRSGDGWHREILRNTRAEIADLGFPNTDVHPLGGAHAGLDSDGAILLWGTSDEYGCCDKQEAARMIARAYPRRRVRVVE